MQADFRTLTALAMLMLTGNVCAAAPAPAVSVAGQQVTFAGTVKRVEAGPHAALFTGDNGQDFVLDLSQARVILPVGVKALTPGQRGTVTGLGNSDGSIAVRRFQVLPPPPAAVPPAAVPEPLDVTVRGTVEAVNLETGAFVLRVNTHTRTVFVTPDTDSSGLGPAASGTFPAQPGRRVTVGGALQPNGTLLAGVLTAKGDLDYVTAATQANRVLFGAVSSPANKLRGRDFRLRLTDGTEVKIGSPHSIPVRRTGRLISIYDLNRRDQVRVTGRLHGPDFEAARIDVLAPPPDAAPAGDVPGPAGRPGL